MRVELLLTVGDAIGQRRSSRDRCPGRPGPSTLTYHIDPDADGQLSPKTGSSPDGALTGDDPADVAIGPRPWIIRFADDRFDWKTVAGDLVTLHWYEGPASFGQRAARIGEDAVRQAADLLGVTETEPIDFFVYADRTRSTTPSGQAPGRTSAGPTFPARGSCSR